jgi:hypothetical protein
MTDIKDINGNTVYRMDGNEIRDTYGNGKFVAGNGGKMAYSETGE